MPPEEARTRPLAGVVDYANRTAVPGRARATTLSKIPSRDLRYGFLVNCAAVPDFLFSTILCLTLGIGRECCVSFSWAEGICISSLPGGSSPGAVASLWPERRGERAKGRNFVAGISSICREAAHCATALLFR